MKKSLFALAAVTAFAGAAQAQSSVTVYGIMDMGVGSFSNKTTKDDGTTTNATGRTTGNGGGALSASRLGFRGVEDLGGGVKAEFTLEYSLTDVGIGGNTLGARQSFVGISDAKLGGLRLGRQSSPAFNALGVGLVGAFNNMPGSIYSQGLTDKSTNSAQVRPVNVFNDNAVTYTSPRLGGLVLQVQTASSNTSASDASPSVGMSTGVGNSSGASLTYTGVKNLTVALAVNNGYSTAASTKDTEGVLAANYNFGVAQAFANYTQKKVQVKGATTRDQKATEIGVRVPVTKVVGVWASTFMGNNNGADDGTFSATTGRTDISGFQLGTTYAMSKRTTAYAIYGQQAVKGKNLASPQKIQSTGMAVGLRHTF